MSIKTKLFTFLIVSSAVLFACKYVVLATDYQVAAQEESEEDNVGWTAVATNIGNSDTGDVHIDITIRNETGEWSAMNAVAEKPAVLTSDGTTTNCDTVFVSSGGHRLAPGFQMRGYIGGTKYEPVTQMLYVECPIPEISAGSTLSMDYVYFTGELDYYHQEDRMGSGVLELNLDEVAGDLEYPVYTAVDGLVKAADATIPAINDNKITLYDLQRTEDGFAFTWNNFNPSEFSLKAHIGNPPVIGEQGIIYGIFEIMDLVSVPVTPAGGETQWTTEVSVPADEHGFYILLSVETKQARWYVNHLIDITGE